MPLVSFGSVLAPRHQLLDRFPIQPGNPEPDRGTGLLKPTFDGRNVVPGGDADNRAGDGLIERTVKRELIPTVKALNLGLTAWLPLVNGVLTGRYHGHGSQESGRISSEIMKQFLPEQERSDRIIATVKAVSDGRQHGANGAGLGWVRPGAGHPHNRRKKAFSVAG
jgi:hypothetical protein